jgi:uncharacterized SAM-binding protein YcdF (DUF218 family)
LIFCKANETAINAGTSFEQNLWGSYSFVYLGIMIRSIANFLLEPHHYLLATVIVLWVLLWRESREKKGVRVLLLVVVSGFLFFLCTPLPEYFISKKEGQFSVVDPSALDTSQKYFIVVLGAGKVSDPALAASHQVNEKTSLRIMEGWRIYRALPQARLALSGAHFNSSVSQAEVSARAAVSWGVNPSDTVQLRSGVNTATEALAVRARLLENEQLIVVSSAIHLPRAKYLFESAGMRPRMAPAHFIIKDDPDAPFELWISHWNQRLKWWGTWLHEAVGLQYAQWRK